MASIDEINAAYDAIELDVHQLIEQFIPQFFRRQAMDKLNSPEGRAMVLDGAKKALTAAERVRAKQVKSG